MVFVFFFASILPLLLYFFYPPSLRPTRYLTGRGDREREREKETGYYIIRAQQVRT